MKRFLSILLALMLFVAVMPTSALADSSKTVYISSTGSGQIWLRSGPGYEYETVSLVYHNNKVSVSGTSGAWSNVKITSGKNKKATGWIRTMYIDGTTKALGTGYKAVVAAANVYADADAASAVKGAVAVGDTVKVTFTQHDFANVTVVGSSLKGWMPIAAIGGTVKMTADKPSGSAKTVYRTTASALNVRAGAGTSFKVVNQLAKGTAVTVLESSGNWRRIKTFNGVTGWVSKNYLTKQATATVATNGSNLNVRKGPGTTRSVLGSLKNGSKVTVISTTGNWAYLKGSGLTGYSSLTYLKF